MQETYEHAAVLKRQDDAEHESADSVLNDSQKDWI